MLKRTKELQERRAEREQIGERLEKEVSRIRIAWLKQDTDRKVRDLLENLGVSDEFKQQEVDKLRRQAITGDLHPLVAYEQIAFVQSLKTTE